MTDRYNGLVVVFDESIRVDDLETWIKAIKIMRKVIKVVPVLDVEEVSEKGYSGLIREQAKYELRNQIYEVLK